MLELVGPVAGAANERCLAWRPMVVLIEMTADEMRALDDEGLCRACVAPAIHRVRGEPLDLRLRVYEELTVGQKALLGFWVLYAHGSGGWTDLRAQLPHLVGHEAFWSTLAGSARHLGSSELLESIVRAKPLLGAPADPVALAELDASWLACRPRVLALAAEYVRAHVDQFVRIRG